MIQTHFKRLSSDMLIYGSGRLVLQLFSFVTLPIFTRIFSPNDYGVIETISTLTSLIALFATLGLESACQRSYFDYGPEQDRQRRAVLSTTFWSVLVSSSCLVFPFVMASRGLAVRLLGGPHYGLLIGIAMITVPVTAVTNAFQEILRLRHRPFHYSLVSILNGIMTVGLALYFVAARRWGLFGNFTGSLLGGLSALGLGYWLVRDAIRPFFDAGELRVMLKYGLPLLPVAASTWIMQWIDRFFLLHYAPLSEVGLYALGVRLSNLILFAVTAFGLAWAPFILELHSRDPLQERHLRTRMLNYVTLGLCFGAVLLSVFAREFFLTITASTFAKAYQVVGLLSAGAVAIGINAVTMTGISLTRQTRYFARYTLYTAALNVGLNFLLIPSWGMIGAAVATLLTYATLSWLYYRRAQLLDPVLYDIRGLRAILISAATIILLGTFINLDPIWLSFAMKVPLVLAFPLLALLLGGLDRQEILSLRTWLGRVGSRAKKAYVRNSHT